MKFHHSSFLTHTHTLSRSCFLSISQDAFEISNFLASKSAPQRCDSAHVRRRFISNSTKSLVKESTVASWIFLKFYFLFHIRKCPLVIFLRFLSLDLFSVDFFIFSLFPCILPDFSNPGHFHAIYGVPHFSSSVIQKDLARVRTKEMFEAVKMFATHRRRIDFDRFRQVSHIISVVFVNRRPLFIHWFNPPPSKSLDIRATCRAN